MTGGAVATAGRAWLLSALDLVFPALCPVCERTLGEGRRDPLCGDCWRRIERIEPPYCDVCGLPFPTFERAPAGPAGRCGECAAAAPGFDYARAGGIYAGVLRDAIHALKFSGKRALARPLADLVRAQCATVLVADADLLVPVPLGRGRQGERGFNQAALIAERLGAALRVPVGTRLLARVRDTAPQTELTAAERRANVRSAFIAAGVAGCHVLLVDDVLTTGATAAECAVALRRAGARRVGVLTVARVL